MTGADQTGMLRVPPVEAEEIVRTARLRNPFNHPTVVYRRTAVLSAGGYRELRYMEDYWVFTRMIANGARVVNLPDPLVRYRVDAGAYERKGGVRQLRSELKLQQRLRSEGFTTVGQRLRNTMVRGGFRLVPTPVRRIAYRRAFTVAPTAADTRLELPVAPAWHRHPSAGRGAAQPPVGPAATPVPLEAVRPTEPSAPATEQQAL